MASKSRSECVCWLHLDLQMLLLLLYSTLVVQLDTKLVILFARRLLILTFFLSFCVRLVTELKYSMQGDLVAVDLSGEDIIGLGFDVFGSPQTGIFIKSVLNRGPARESGCMEAGDRIKCLNISFENITLQDATDILNCAAPYKMRLLLEKRVVVAARPTPTKKFAITFRAQTNKQSKASAI